MNFEVEMAVEENQHRHQQSARVSTAKLLKDNVVITDQAN